MNEPKIEIDVRKIYRSEIGVSQIEKINKRILNLYEITLKKPIIGTIKLTNLGENLLADINLKTVIQLECSKCLKNLQCTINLNYQQNYKNNPSIDEFAISSSNKIDVWPSIRQEIIVNTPMQPLCNKNCKK